MKQLRNEKGVALVMSLMFTLICLGMILMLLYSVLSSVKSSGAQARYRNSLEASYGGVEFVTKTAIERVFENFSTGKLSLISDFGSSDRFGLIVHDSLREKMHTATADWTGDDASKSVKPKVSPDLEFMLPGASGTPTYKIYSKITDTVTGVGVLDDSGIDYLDPGLAVVGTGSATSTMRTPNMYTIEVLGESAVRPKEKANLTVLYAY